MLEPVNVDDGQAKRRSRLNPPLDLALHAKPAAQAGQRIAGGNFFSLIQLGLIIRDLHPQLIDGGLAFCGHAIDGILQVRSTLHNRSVNHSQVVEPGNLVQPRSHFVELLCAALVSLPHRFGGARQNQQQLLHLAGLLQVVPGRALAPILQLLLNASLRSLHHLAGDVRGQRIVQLLQPAFQSIAQSRAGLHAVLSRLQQRRTIGSNRYREQIPCVRCDQRLQSLGCSRGQSTCAALNHLQRFIFDSIQVSFQRDHLSSGERSPRTTRSRMVRFRPIGRFSVSH